MEHLPTRENHEQGANPEQLKAEHEVQERLREKVERAAEKAPDHKEHIPELQNQAKEEALPAEHVNVAEKEDKQPSSLYVSRELKQMTLQRTLKRVRRHLSTPDKVLSKVIHQPVIDSVSKIGEKTVARPSGILGGSILAFVGSSAFLWAAKHYGFAYNYLLFFLLFIGGFALGALIEMVLAVVLRRRSS